MNKLIAGLIGAMALCAAASPGVAAQHSTPGLSDGAQVQMVQYDAPNGYHRPVHRQRSPHRAYRRDRHYRPHHVYRHRNDGYGRPAPYALRRY